ALARFGAQVPHPEFAAVAGASGQRDEVLGQRTAIADAAGLDRLRGVDDQWRVAGLVERVAGVDCDIETPVLVDHESLVEAHQREGAWTVFADLALVEGAGE